MTRHRQIGTHLHLLRAIVLCIEPTRRRRGHHAGSPDNGVGTEPPVLELDARWLEINT
jgi:hypothetical protein